MQGHFFIMQSEAPLLGGFLEPLSASRVPSYRTTCPMITHWILAHLNKSLF